MLFYDFEVFKYDWLVVVIDSDTQKESVIINDRDQLEALYKANKYNIWVGFNSRHYDGRMAVYKGTEQNHTE